MRISGFLCAFVLLATTRTAAAEPAAHEGDQKSVPDAASSESKDSPAFGHERQFGLRAGVVGGYRMVFRYDESPYCAEPDPAKTPKDQQKFCGHAAPLAAELAVSFAPVDSLEPFLFGRLGLASEDETDTKPLVLLGAGFRAYTMSDSALKVFIEPAIGWELEGGGDDPRWRATNPKYKKDVVFHLAAGPQYDFAKNFGAFLDAGITTGILRSIHSNLEVQAGVQLRVP